MSSPGSSALWYLVVFVMWVWMIIKVARVSTGMAILTFLFWPAAIFHLISHWADDESDIKIPYLIAVIASGMAIYSVFQAAKDVAVGAFTQEDIEEIRRHDPDAAALIELEQRKAMGTDDPQSTAGVLLSNDDAQPASTDLASAEVAPQNVPARPRMRKVPIGDLNLRRGEIRLDPAFSNLTLPEHFRYIPAEQLGLLSEVRKHPVDAAVFAWIVHERIDLNQQDFWFVEARFESTGYLPAPLPPPVAPVTIPAEAADATVPVAASTPDAGAAAAPEPDPFALTWDAERAIATWSESAATPGLVDQCAARLLRHGAMLFCVPELDPARRELGLRAARLVAARTRIDPGWHHANFVGGSAAQSFEQWLASRRPLALRPKAAVEPEETKAIEAN